MTFGFLGVVGSSKDGNFHMLSKKIVHSIYFIFILISYKLFFSNLFLIAIKKANFMTTFIQKLSKKPTMPQLQKPLQSH